MDDQFSVEIVVFKDEMKEEFHARLKIIIDAKTIEQAIVTATDLLELKQVCKYYTVKKVKNNCVA